MSNVADGFVLSSLGDGRYKAKWIPSIAKKEINLSTKKGRKFLDENGYYEFSVVEKKGDYWILKKDRTYQKPETKPVAPVEEPAKEEPVVEEAPKVEVKKESVLDKIMSRLKKK